MIKRRTQTERRAETQAAILASAINHFGKDGYADTSLEKIAQDCGISIAPIYHYFKNKKNLFEAVNGELEKQILDSADNDCNEMETITRSWKKFLDLCQDANFRQIVLIDGPNILGKERTHNSDVAKAAAERMRARFHAKSSNNYKAEILSRMLMGALAEAGLFVGNCDDPQQASKDAAEIVSELVARIK